MKKLLCLLVLCGAFCGCNSDPFLQQFKQLDAQLENAPEMVLDSLKRMDVHELNTSQRAYYNLLYASATDKNLIELSNDSCLIAAFEYFAEQKDVYNMARCQYYLGKYDHKHNLIKSAFEFFKKAEYNAKESNKEADHLLGLIYYQQGLILKQEYNYSEAEKVIKKSYDKFLAAKDTISAAYSLKIIGLIKLNRKDYSASKENLFQSLELIEQINDKSIKQLSAKRSMYIAISNYYQQINNYKNATQYLNQYKSISLDSNYHNSTEYCFNFLRIHFKQDQIDSAKFYCNKMISIGQKERNHKKLTSAVKYLADIVAKEGDYKKAYMLSKRAELLRDTLLRKLDQNNVLALEKKYNYSENQRLLIKAKYERFKAQIVIIAFAFIITLMSFIWYKHSKKSKIRYKNLSGKAKQNEWGFLVAKEFITQNHIAFEEWEKLLNREKRLGNISPEFYHHFYENLNQYKENYSARLFHRLNTLDGTFIHKLQSIFPKFNTEELLLSVLIHYQWKLVDIAIICHVSTEAIRKRKGRLKNKISAKLNKEIDIDDFLIHL